MKNNDKKVRVYSLSMKEEPYCIKNDVFKTLQLGSINAKEHSCDYRDDFGDDNISSKNKWFCDLTGIYWIWKNLGDLDYVGNENYRRHFNLTKDEIVDELSKNDIIVGSVASGDYNIYDSYKGCHNIHDLDVCCDVVNDLYPEIGKVFSNFIHNEKKLYCANGYITSKENYNIINNFIFSILFEIEKRYGFTTEEEWKNYVMNSEQKMMPKRHERMGLKYYDYQMFIMSFLYERLFTFYVSYLNLKVVKCEYKYIDTEYASEQLKVMLVCIGRLENNYIREYVSYYKALGVTNICLCDNNRTGEDDFNDVIGDYIDSGFVILKDYRNNMPPIQLEAYNNVYAEYKNDYDWFLFLDIDEFVFLNEDKNIRMYLSRDSFEDADVICMNWLCFGDCDRLESDGRGVLERFDKPLDLNLNVTYDFPENFHVKSFIRGGKDIMDFKYDSHLPVVNGLYFSSFGTYFTPTSPFLPYDFRLGGIRHYTTKTASEFANKVNRGFCDASKIKKEDLINSFFKRNKVTKEKVDIFIEKCGVDVSYLLPNKFEGKKSDDAKIFSLCYSKKDFKFLDDELITPLQVGAANGTDVCELKDNTFDNISDKNYFYVENTGTYWIWKNVTGAKYKGQMQYRRPLEGVSGSMDIEGIFKDHDVITCKPFNHPENSIPTKENPMCIPAKTVEGGYAFSNCIDDLSIMEVVVKTFFKEYSSDWDKYIKNGENLYYSNGFIMRSEDYDRYCEFLFKCLDYYLKMTNINTEEDLINHVKYNIEVGKYIRYEQGKQVSEEAINWQCKIGGFLSERLWTLWVMHNFNKERIYELPYIKMENNMYT